MMDGAMIFKGALWAFYALGSLPFVLGRLRPVGGRMPRTIDRTFAKA